MFSNPVYNFSSQFNENLLAQNLAGLNLNPGLPHGGQQQPQNFDYGSYQYPQQQQQQQHAPVEIGGYVPPSLNDSNTQWSAPDEVNVTYQRGSTVVRQYNNSTIDDYYKKFLRPITDYVPIPTNGQPTYVYQNLDGQQGAPLGQKPVSGGEVHGDVNVGVPASIPQPSTDRSEEKKHKKKHKKRSSKHGHGESSKHAEGEGVVNELKTETTENVDHQHYQQPPPPPPQQQQQVMSAPPDTQLGGEGPKAPMRDLSNPVVYFDVEIDGEARGRLVMELFRHVLPRTAQNFLALCLNEYGFGFRLSYFHRIIPGFMAQGGDFEKSNGTGGYSIYGEKFDDEGFPYPHDRPGLLSMANSGPNTNGSQFFITFEPCSHLDNKHVVFGQVVQGFHLLKDLEMSGSEDGECVREVKIANSGQLQ